MCDTLCVVSERGTLFAKNSDRPAGEVQLPVAYPPRPAGGKLRTQYLEIDDDGAAAVLLSSPDWLWGAEHGVNEHGVAIGNEKVDTRSNMADEPPALIGMDLVRLGLERGRGATEALEVMVDLLERHGQGGIADRTFERAYDSSFLVTDASSAWILETAGRTWAARPVPAGCAAAISNRLTIRRDWTRASADVPAGADFDAWRHPRAATGHADSRLAASRAFLGSDADNVTPASARSAGQMVSHLRDHGRGPWGEPGARAGSGSRPRAVPPPSESRPDGTGITVCMHAGGMLATTASWVVEIPRARPAPVRSWLAVGSPCVAVYVPMFEVNGLPSGLVDGGLWQIGSVLRQRVEADGNQLDAIREVLDPLESTLWGEADDLVDRPDRWPDFQETAWRRVSAALTALAGGPP